MIYKGYTITAEVETFDYYTIDEDGGAGEYVRTSENGVEVTGYDFESKTDNFFETTKQCTVAELKQLIDQRIKELKAGRA